MPKKESKGSVELADNSLSPINDIGLWRFAITMGGFIVNGFTYNAVSRQIRPPTCDWGNGEKKIVRAHGIHIIRLRDKVEAAIEDGRVSNK